MSKKQQKNRFRLDDFELDKHSFFVVNLAIRIIMSSVEAMKTTSQIKKVAPLRKKQSSLLNSYLATTSSSRSSAPRPLSSSTNRLVKNSFVNLEAASERQAPTAVQPAKKVSTDQVLPKTQELNPQASGHEQKPFMDLTATLSRGEVNEMGQKGVKTATDDPHDQLFARKRSLITESNRGFSSNKSESFFTPLQKNLTILIFGVFLLGITIFGIDQLIKNANVNLAAENQSTPPPQVVTFQGRLSDTYWQEAVTGTMSMRFEMYDTSGGNTPDETTGGPVGGNRLWDSNYCAVTLNDEGVFTVNLGAGNGDGEDETDCGGSLGDIFTQNSNVWLQITVVNVDLEDEVLFPRQMIKSVPYALNAGAVNGYSANSIATANSIPVVNSDGNIVLNTTNTSLINYGRLNLVSETGDIYLLPGKSSVYVGDYNQAADIIVTGNASVSGNLTLGNTTNAQQQIEVGSNGNLTFKSTAGQNLWQNLLTLTNNGLLGLGTTSPNQKLTINGGSVAFNFADTPVITGMTAEEEAVNTAALSSGAYRYKVTFITSDGESNPSESIAVVVNGSKIVKLSNIPLAGANVGVTARKIYRTLADSNVYYLVATITDNTTTEIYDNINDQTLVNQPLMTISGGVYTNGKLSLQFNADGSVTTNEQVNVSGRIEVNHGDNQGLKLPTSLGKPFAKVGQEAGDIVYDTVGQTLYIYNGSEFVAAGGGSSSTISNSSNCSGNVCRLVLDAEYTGAVITGDGSNNIGSLESGYEIVDNNYRFNYYQWKSSSTSELNDIDTVINLTLPENFANWQNAGVTLDFLTQSTNTADNSVSVEISKSGSATASSQLDVAGATANQWSSRALGNSSLAFSQEDLAALEFQAGDTLTMKITTKSMNNNVVKIGQINLNYIGNSVVSNGSQSIWKQLTGVIFTDSTSDVVLGGNSTASAKIGFFNLGGVGTPTLYVKGNIFADSDSGTSYFDLAHNNSLVLRTENEDGSTTPRLTVLPNGNIGIGNSNPTEALDINGNLNVNGTIQLGAISASQVGACDASSEGKIYYDQDTLKLNSCQQINGSYTWTVL